MSFQLDPRLAADSVPVATLALCQVRLMNDARFPWCLLVPQVEGLRSVLDLSDPQHAALWDEARLVATALRDHCRPDRLNVATLGNIVTQLHLHVVARYETDAAWPGPVWGFGTASAYPEATLRDRVRTLAASLRSER